MPLTTNKKSIFGSLKKPTPQYSSIAQPTLPPSPNMSTPNGPRYGGGSYSPTTPAPSPQPVVTRRPTARQSVTPTAPSNSTGLTPAQIAAGYSTVPGAYDPVTGQLKSTNTEPTIGSAYNMPSSIDPGYNKAQKDYIDYYENGRGGVDEESVRSSAMRMFQAEIDATNQIYNEKLRQSQLAGQGRLGSGTAIQARRGLLGSDFGAAQTQDINTMNTQANDMVQQERAVALAAIMDKASKAAADAISEKRAAFEKGLDARLEYYKGADERNNSKATTAAQSLLDQGFSPDKLFPDELNKLATGFGISADAIKAKYASLKKESDAAAADAAQKGQFNLSEGQARYDADGNIIAARGKTYAPGSGGGSSSVGIGGGLEGYPPDIQSAAQSILDGRSKLNEYPSGKRLQINAAMSTVYKAAGGNELAQGAYDSILALENHPGFKGAIGAKGIISGLGGLKKKPMAGTPAAGFISELDKLKANIKLVNIKYLKGTGALSDSEGKTLEDAGTSLNPSLPEADFKRELARVKAALIKANNVQQSEGGSYTVLSPEGEEIEIVDE